MSAPRVPAAMSGLDEVRRVLAAVRARGDAVLVEPDGFPLLRAIGIACPAMCFVRGRDEVAALDTAAWGERVVVKVASPEVLHRSDVGGVAVVPNRLDAIGDAVAAMAARLSGRRIHGFTVNELVPFDRSLGGELLLGLRWTEDFGAVVTLGAGGIHAEALAKSLRAGQDVAIVPVAGAACEDVAARIADLPVVRWVTGTERGQPPRVALDSLVEVVEAFRAMGRALVPDELVECEINPLAIGPHGPVALDVLARLGSPRNPPARPRPVARIERLLRPRTVAIVGVSEQQNPGRVILDNLLREGFPAADLFVVKPKVSSIAGVRCVPDLASLPGRVDLLVLAVSAEVVPAMLLETIARERAESVIVIPGGLEEKEGGAALMSDVRRALEASRGTPWGGPVLNGGNCLGIRSRPGRYDTMFIPAWKLSPRPQRPSPVAILSQSGAFAIAKEGRIGPCNPKYVVTFGNQTDLTAGDWLSFLADDEEIRLFAVYVEGFRPRDGGRFLEAARRIVQSGRRVVFYRAGRTAAGAAASASHTASIAGDWAVTRELARGAGVIVAESLEELEDLVRLGVALEGRPLAGTRLGAMSNAGFECVAIADNLGGFELAQLGAATTARLREVLAGARIDRLVDIHNPLDVTPMANDATFTAAADAILDDPDVDVGLIGCVPLTGALATLPKGAGHGEDLAAPGALAARLAVLWQHTTKPWAAVVDAGALYDPFVARLEESGIPVFRAADRALARLNALGAAAPGPALPRPDGTPHG